jgi:uncharacterized protein (DUF427 family)
VENVWDYPRPPALVACERRVRIRAGGELIADSRRALRVLETSHPPTIYVPPEDIRMDLLAPSAGRGSLCEWKGLARYYDVAGRARAAWAYPEPVPRHAALKDHVAFYPGRMDACHLDDEQVQAQPGDPYAAGSAQVTRAVRGGRAPGTLGW